MSFPPLKVFGLDIARKYLEPALAKWNKSSAVAEMGDRLATIDVGRKVGNAVPLSVGELGPHVTQRRLGRGLPPCQVAS